MHSNRLRAIKTEQANQNHTNEQSHLILPVPHDGVHRLVVGEDRRIVLALQHLSAAVQAGGTLVEQHL